VDVRVDPKTLPVAASLVLVRASWFPVRSSDTQSLDTLRIFCPRTLAIEGLNSRAGLLRPSDSERSTFTYADRVQCRGRIG